MTKNPPKALSSEEKLRREREFFRQVIDLNPSFIFAKDREGRFTLVNQAVAEAYGTSVEGLIGKTDADFNPNLAEVEHFRRFDLEAMDSLKEMVIPEEIITDSTGRLRWLQTVKRPIVDENGVANQILGVATDITQRKKIEEELRASEERFRLLAENLPGVVYLCRNDPRFSMVYLNDAVQKLTGYSKNDFLTDKISFVDLYHPTDKAYIFTEVERSLACHESFHLTYRIMHASGEWRWVDEVGVGILRDDALFLLEGYLIDVTERKKSEARLIELQDELRHSQKMEAIGSLAGGVAHDFNNLLTAIVGFADLLSSGASNPDEVLRTSELISDAAKRAEDLTSQLLGFARRGKHQNIPVNIHGMIDDVAGLLQRTIEKHIVVEKRFQAEKFHVLGDPVQMQQVLLNLGINARDALAANRDGLLIFETNQIHLDTAASGDSAAKPSAEYLRISVTDNGCGIDPEVKHRVFEPFFTTKEVGKGTGMGLAMVYGIVHNHGGTVSVHSEPEKGTTFEILLPLTECKLSDEITKSDPTVITGSGTVLLVDDEGLVREVGSAMLKKLGYTVLVAEDGKEALEIYASRKDRIDLVIIDMMMPEMDGKECYLQLARLNPQVRAILSTGYGLNLAAQRALDEGFIDFIQKPYRMAELSQVLAKALAEKPT